MDGLPAHLDAVLERAGMALWESSVGEDCLLAGVVQWSAAGAALAGMDGPGAMPFSAFLERVHSEDSLRVLNELGRGRGGTSMALEFRVRARGHGLRRLALRVELQRLARAGPVRAVGVLWDVVWTVPLSDGQALDPRQAALAMAALPQGLIATDAHACITYMNPAAERMSGASRRTVVGRAIQRALQFQHADGQPQHECALLRCLRLRHDTGGASDCVLVADDGRRLVIEETAAPIVGADGAIEGAVLSIRDVSHERKINQQLSWKATHDALTGLLNRGEFESRLSDACHAARSANQQHALLYMDLDRFKIVNDTCGHAAGDVLLQQLTTMLLTHMRDSDTLARLGGDELGVLLLHCPLDKAQRVAEGLRQAVEDFRFNWETHVFQLGISIGIAGIDNECAQAQEVLAVADAACYVAKKNGRHCIHVHPASEATGALQQEKNQWLSTLTEAFIQDDFRLFAMPVVALRGGIACHDEILMRLRTAEGAILLADAFLPAAQRYDLMLSIDRWVVAGVCRYLGHRQPAGQASGALCAVNLSHAALVDPDFAGYVVARFHEYGVAPAQVCFEIDEAELHAAPDAVHAFVIALHSCGCSFSLDNFSGAIRSFVSLKTLPVNYLKIDGLMVRATATDAVYRLLVRAINDVAHAMGITTVAGHVENEAILAAIREIGVDCAQGYAIGSARPLNAAGH